MLRVNIKRVNMSKKDILLWQPYVANCACCYIIETYIREQRASWFANERGEEDLS
ncbi:hypothetical protein PAE4_160001 [Bacillus altitudinis]|nr:hypothetical protein PAE4_160001 [Bacillus altitudinis]